MKVKKKTPGLGKILFSKLIVPEEDQPILPDESPVEDERILNGKLLETNENKIKPHVDQVVKNAIKQMLNALLD